ncbi:MAG: glycosyltransferase family 39 protein, partial [Anaerolineae bacterium]|nr:glycosyltransferase family 39 protein [Anaerolineae bacterium]
MQNVDTLPTRRAESVARTWSLSYEQIAYIVLAALAFVLYFASLDMTPLKKGESRAALAAYRYVHAEAPGEALIAPSPTLFLAQTAAFNLLGHDEFAARVGTALAGMLLVLTPILFRRALGVERSLLMSILLLGSPVVLVSARGSSSAVWAALLAALTLWAGWRWWAERRERDAILLLIFCAGLIFLAEPGGILMALALVGALLSALVTTPAADDEDDEEEPVNRLAPLGERLRAFPWLLAGGVALFVTIAVATVFFFYPAGLTATGDLLARFVDGFVARPANTPAFFPLRVSLFYEPWFWLLAAACLVWSWRRLQMDFIGRFALAWLILGALAAIIYNGAGAEHALWLTLPLVLLVSGLAQPIFAPYDVDEAPGWARWLTALAVFALLAMASIAFQGVARSVARFGTIQLITSQADTINLIVLLIALAFMLVGYFLVRSFWESDGVPLRGAAIGLVTFACLTSLGAGWRTAVSGAGNPVDLWQRRAVSPNLNLLRASLLDLADRTTRGYTEMQLGVVTGGDPLIAWQVRDFNNALLAGDVASVRGEPVILIPAQAI